jgi:2-methylcitrate dehydratase PrpD
MNDLTERLCSTLLALPKEQVTVQGARLVHQVWSHFPKNANRRLFDANARASGALVATAFRERKVPVENAAFNNAFRFAEQCTDLLLQQRNANELTCLAVPVFSATALAEARGRDCNLLCYAVGLGMEAHSRVRVSLAESAGRRGINADLLAATLAAIIACGKIENLSSQQVARALGLGSSAITAVSSGYLPLQAATAARDGIVMVLLVGAGFIGPPDPLACRWGVYETFANAEDARSLDLDSRNVRADAELQRLLGRPTEGDAALYGARGSMPVGTFLAGL